MEEQTTKQKIKSSGLLKSEDLHQYILETSVYPREPQLLKELRDATAAHPRAYMSASPVAGQLMNIQLKLLNAKRTLEVGVFTGYSLLLTALSLSPHGQITAIDMDRDAYGIGLPFIRRAGMEHKINFIHSQALPALDNLLEQDGNEGSYDFAFIDADKTNYHNYHERILKLVRAGGLAIYDNTLWGGTVAMPEESVPEFMKEYRQALIKFNKFLANDPRIEISHVPVGDGITICRRLY